MAASDRFDIHALAPSEQPHEHSRGTGESGLDLAVVCVLHNSARVVADCVSSIPSDVEVILVDNASADDGVLRAQAVRADMVVLRSERNLGFGGGCNLGWKAANRRFVAFINPDVRLQPRALDVLRRRLTAESHSVVGPAVLDSSGIPRPCNQGARVLSDFIHLLPSATRWAPVSWNGKLRPSDPLQLDGGSVSYVEGACFALRRADLEAIGGFDEDLFLYCEEESLAIRLAKLGGRAVYEPRARVEHIGGDSTSIRRDLATQHFYRSRILLYRKRDGNLSGLLAAGVLCCGVFISVPAAAINTVLRRRRHNGLRHLWYALCGIVGGALSPREASIYY